MKRATMMLAACVFFASPAAAKNRTNAETASRVLLEKMGQGRFEISSEIYGPGFVAHGFGRDYSLAEDNESGRQIRTAFPDLKVAVLRTVESADFVAVHWQSEGTNTIAAGPFPGTGKRVRVDGMTFFRFAGGRIVEEWTTYDNLAVLQQLGLIPSK